MTKRIHYIKHVPFEGLGCIEEWISENGHSLSLTELDSETPYPSTDDFDFLIILGGPMSVYDDGMPRFDDEKKFIRSCLAAGKPIVGICLGAQLLADALGSPVYRNKTKEIGWHKISVTPDGKSLALLTDFPEEAVVFQWHGDTFDIPENAVRLFESEECRNQAFLYRNNVLALQFHFEANLQSVRELAENASDEIVAAPGIQTLEEILTTRQYIPGNNIMMYALLDRLIS